MQNDVELLEASLTGDKQSFGQIVDRYKSVICTITYNATGNIAVSEDIAQETFITAWKGLKNLRDKSKFKSWLYGIARNLSSNYIRKRYKDLTHRSIPLEDVQEKVISQVTPRDEAISKEEESILWKALEEIPATYREPLILYYRENQSINAVAEALDLSEDTVKQRLSRGRNMLRIQVADFVENTLAQTAPKQSFAIAVLAALPALTSQITATGITLTATKSSGAMKSAISFLFFGVILNWILTYWAGIILGVFGLLSGILGATLSICIGRTPQERQFLFKAVGPIFILTAIFPMFVIFGPSWLSILFGIFMGIFVVIRVIRMRSQYEKIMIEDGAYINDWKKYFTKRQIVVANILNIIPICVFFLMARGLERGIFLIAFSVITIILGIRSRRYPQRIYQFILWYEFSIYLITVTVIFFRWESWKLALNGTYSRFLYFVPNRIEMIVGVSVLYLLFVFSNLNQTKKYAKIPLSK